MLPSKRPAEHEAQGGGEEGASAASATGGELKAVLVLYGSPARGEFLREDAAMLQPFAQQAAIAVRGLRLKGAIGDAEERLALAFCTIGHVSEDIDEVAEQAGGKGRRRSAEVSASFSHGSPSAHEQRGHASGSGVAAALALSSASSSAAAAAEKEEDGATPKRKALPGRPALARANSQALHLGSVAQALYISWHSIA
jgi:hypothetical protein